VAKRLLTGSFGQGEMPDEAAAFMYSQLAIEEMP